MRRRHVLALAALAFFTLTAGCLGPGSLSAEQLDEEPAEPYAFDSNRDAHIVVQTDSSFRAVYNVSSNEVELFRRDGFGGRNPLNVRALRYRYPNGTVVDGSGLEANGGSVERTRSVVRVTLPEGQDGGELAFTAGATPKRFSIPTFVEGSYEVVLPVDRRVDFPVFGTVSPRGYETSIEEGRTHIRWDEVTSRSVSVQYYLQRDLGIFAVVAAISILVGGAGAYRYKRQIEALKRQREDLGLDVEIDEDDEFDDGPPPGMR